MTAAYEQAASVAREAGGTRAGTGTGPAAGSAAGSATRSAAPGAGPGWQLGLAPEVRMALYGYQAEYGSPPATVWRVPGTVTLLAGGSLRLTVATPWAAVAAAGPPPDGDGLIELARMERPGERERVAVATAADGHGPAWAVGGALGGAAGARLIVRSELPEGSGAGASAAVDAALRLCLRGPAARAPGAAHAPGRAVLGALRLSCDLAAAGLRLMLIDTRVRRASRPAAPEDSPLEAAATALAQGDFAALGALLTAAHQVQPCDDLQYIALSAALQAGALGGRAVADGAGRPVCVLVAADRVTAVRVKVAADFARAGARPPRFLTFTPAAGPAQPLTPAGG
jgi:galactokinase